MSATTKSSLAASFLTLSLDASATWPRGTPSLSGRFGQEGTQRGRVAGLGVLPFTALGRDDVSLCWWPTVCCRTVARRVAVAGSDRGSSWHRVMAFGGSGALPKRILKVRGGEGLGSWRAGGCSEGARQSPEWKREEKVPGPCCMGWEVDCLCTRERHVAEHGARRGCVGVSPVRRRCRDRWREVAAGGYLQTVWAPADAVVWVHCFIEWLGVSYLALGVAQETERLLSDPGMLLFRVSLLLFVG